MSTLKKTILYYLCWFITLPSLVFANNNLSFSLERPPENPVTIWKTHDPKRQHTITNVISNNQSKLFSNNSPSSNNKEPETIIVEFFDYQCGHCKKVSANIATLKSSNPHLKIIYKELPIVNQTSVFAAKVALAAHKQNKYEAMHYALMAQHGRLSKPRILNLAKNLDIDMTQLKKDIELEAIEENIAENYALSRKLTITGTPSLLISSVNKTSHPLTYFVPGSTDIKALQTMILNIKQSSP